MHILNLTQHLPTDEQLSAGVVNYVRHDYVRELLTINDLPDYDDLRLRAVRLAKIALESDAQGAMIGGAPYLMSHLEAELKAVGIVPMYAFSKRVSVDVVGNDGVVRKDSVFKHLGFYSA